jgi:small subunit ribosomal protein S16
MAVVIRLARCGTKHKPKYRVQVADSRKFVTSKYIENLGTYIPKVGVQKEDINLDHAKIAEWVKKGAQPTATVKHLIKKSAQSVAK